MTLLRLTPDGERLRRIAKAHAAGELSTPDYRRIRGDVIEGFAPHPSDITGDDTKQRWSVEDPSAATAAVAPPLLPAAPAARAWPRMLAVVLGVVLLILLFAANPP